MANVTVDGVSLQSGFAVVEEGKQLVEIPALTLYETTEDTSGLGARWRADHLRLRRGCDCGVQLIFVPQPNGQDHRRAAG
ncbi:MAG: hypothetical protein U0X93_04205 [Anaerolineales bacterium]